MPRKVKHSRQHAKMWTKGSWKKMVSVVSMATAMKANGLHLKRTMVDIVLLVASHFGWQQSKDRPQSEDNGVV